MKMFFILIPFLLFTFCSEEIEETISQNHKTSGCGGFAYLKKTTAIPDSIDTQDYCSGEKLRWTYNAQSGIIELLLTRILINCGLHSLLKVTKNGEVFVLTVQVDEDPQRVADCMCYFDYSCELPNQNPGIVNIQINNQVYDLNLHEGHGVILLGTGIPWPCGDEY